MNNKIFLRITSFILSAMTALLPLSLVYGKEDDAQVQKTAELTQVYDGGTGWGELIRNAGTLDEDTPHSKEEVSQTNIRASVEGMVLLENKNQALPLKSTDKIAVFGSSQLWNGIYARFGFRQGGAGSGAVYSGPGTSLINEIRKKADEGRFSIYNPISELYEKYYLPNATLYPDTEGNYYNDGEYALAEDNGKYFPTDQELQAAKAAGVNKVVYVFSRLEGEGGTEESFLPSNGEFEVKGVPDDAPEPGQYYLSANEEAHLKKLRENFDTVIVVANTGDLIDTSWAKYGIDFDKDGTYTPVADAVLFSWYGGLRGTQALSLVLSGEETPSGKLSETAARSVDDYITTEGFFEKDFTNYTEDIFNGYRYFETFDPEYKKVNYEFGYGLSYTTFDISDIKYSHDGEFITVSAKITNTGDYNGKEVFQVYFSAPQMGEGSAVLSKPGKELASYVKTKLLAPGESEVVTAKFPIKDMSSFDDTGVTGKKSAYVLEAGDYDILAGNSVRNVVKAGTYKVDALTVTEQLTTQAAPYDLEKRLLADGTYEELELREKPVEEYTPSYGLPRYGNIKIEGEKFDTMLSKGAPGSESFTTGTLINEPIYLDEKDSAGDFDYKTAAKSPYGGSHLCQMHVSVKQAVYPINVGKAGYYNIHIRGSGTGITDFLGLYVNGENTGLSFNWPKTRGGGEYFAHADVYYHESKMVYLPEGNVIIALENKNIGFINLDFIEFIPCEGEVEVAPTVITVEGESYDTENSVGVKTEDNKYTPQLATNIVWSSENVVDYANSTWISNPGTCVSGISANDTIVYNIEAPESGNYAISMIACRPTSVVSDFTNIRVDDTLYEFDEVFPQTGGQEIYFKYIDWDFGGDMIVPLKKGSNTVTFEITGSGVLIDKIFFTKINVPIVVEAESYDETASSGTYKKETAWNSAQYAASPVMTDALTVDFDNTVWEQYENANPGTCVSGINAGANLVYKVNVPEAGNYLFSMRACRPTRCHVNFMDIILNGEKKVYAVNFPQTGLDETKYFRYIDNAFENKIILPLVEGENTITLVAKTTMPLIDKFFLTKTALDIPNDIIIEGETLIAGESVGATYETLSTSSGKYALSPVINGTAVDVDNTTWHALVYSGAKNLARLGDSTGNTAVYKVNVPVEGTYGLIVRGARSNASTSPNWVSINDTVYTTDAFPKTGGAGVYFNFIDVDYSDSVKLKLSKGENKITFKNVAGAPNIDFFVLKYIKPEVQQGNYVKPGDEPYVFEDGIVTFTDVQSGIHTARELVSQLTLSELASFAVLTRRSNSAQSSGVGPCESVTKTYGVPVGSTVDGPAGPTTMGVVGFASGMTIGCSWNVDIAADFGIVVGKACKSHGDTNYWLAPGMNIQRNPLGGRNFEYFSEDPLITGLCGAAITEKVQKYGTSVAAKHFAVNNKETNRSLNDSRISERALREIYLRGFEIFVKESRPLGIMTGYNLVNGYECCENREMLTGIARNEWGFDGLFMTDWCKTPSLYKMVKAGCNTNMGNYENVWDSEVLVEQYVAGNLTRDELEENAAYIVNSLARLDISDGVSVKQDYRHTLSSVSETVIEAEEYSKAYNGVKTESRSGASGGKNLGSMDKKDENGNVLSFAEFTVDVPADTEYEIFIAVSTYSSNIDADFYLDGKIVDAVAITEKNTSTSDWNVFKEYSMGKTVIEEGTHTIRIMQNKSSGAFNFDLLRFVPTLRDNVSFRIPTVREYTAGMTIRYTKDEYGNDVYGSEMILDIAKADNPGNVILTINEKDCTYISDETGNAVINTKATIVPGEYIMTVRKNGYVKTEVAFTVGADGKVTMPEITLEAGDVKADFEDVCGDGIVDIDDFIRVLRGFAVDETSAVRAVVDINEDGVVNVSDLALVKMNFSK